ncbi:MAG: hypothetical protein AAGK37_02965 [Pseudomonadota bacterium]
MKHLTAVAAIALFASGCVSDTGTPTAAAVDQFIGKQLVAADGTTFLFAPNGTVGGTFRGEEVVGTYTSDAAEICSTYTMPEALTGREFCSTPSVDGNSVVFNRRDGSQSALYTIQG